MKPREYSREKSHVRSSARCELAMIFASDIIVSCMSFSTTWTLCSVLIVSGSTMSFVLWRMLRREGYLMRGSTEVGEQDDQIEEALSTIGVANWRRRLEGCVATGRYPLIGLL